MVDIVKALNQKTEPLAKKADNLGVPKPTQPNLATALGATDKSAQMAPTPQAKQATQKQTSEQQKSQRSAKIQAEAPRDIAGAADLNSKAAAIIGSIADTITAERVQGAVDTTVDPASGHKTQGELYDLIREEDVAQSGTVLEGPEGEDIDLSAMGETFNIPVSQVLSPEELSEITEVFGPEAANMTIDQLQARVEEEADAITAQVDDNREILNDPNQPPDVRKVARQNMIDLGAAHLIATDAELDAFEQDLSTADAIEIQGQTYSLEDLQDNEMVMSEAYKIATELLNDPDQNAEDFPGTSESFFNFIKNHANAIQSVYADNKIALNNVQEKVDANKLVLGWTEGFSPDLLGALGLGGFSTYKNNDFSGLPGLEVFRTGNDTDQSLLKQMAELDPRMVGQFLKTNDANLLNKMKERKKSVDLIDGYTSPESAVSLFGVSDYNRLKQLVAEGMESGDPRLTVLDSDGNGQIDDWAEVQRRLKGWALRGRSFNLSGMQTKEERRVQAFNRVMGSTPIEELDLSNVNRIMSELKFKGMEVPPELEARRKTIIDEKTKARQDARLKSFKTDPKALEQFTKRAMTRRSRYRNDPTKDKKVLETLVNLWSESNHPRKDAQLKYYSERLSVVNNKLAKQAEERAAKEKAEATNRARAEFADTLNPLEEKTRNTVVSANDMPQDRSGLLGYKQSLEGLLKEWKTSNLPLDLYQQRVYNIEQVLNVVNRTLKRKY